MTFGHGKLSARNRVVIMNLLESSQTTKWLSHNTVKVDEGRKDMLDEQDIHSGVGMLWYQVDVSSVPVHAISTSAAGIA